MTTTIEEATQRLIDTATSSAKAANDLLTKALDKVDALTQDRDQLMRTLHETAAHATVLMRQRDELAACLREVLNAMGTGTIVIAPGKLLGNAFQYMTLANRCQAALLRLEVRERLDDKLQAEAKP